MPYQKNGRGSKPNKGYVGRKRKTKLTRKAVLKMLAVMEASQNANSSPGSSDVDNVPTTEAASNGEEFLQSGRTGRRNALADILSQHAAVTSSDLPSRLEGLTTKDKNETTDKNTTKKSEENKPGTSKS